jgi:hypothetical protein
VKGGVKEGVAQGFMKAMDGDTVSGAFVLEDVDPPEHSGDIFPDGEGGGFFDDDHIDAERFGSELDFALELEGVEIRFKFKLEGLDESGMPGDRRRDSHDEPPGIGWRVRRRDLPASYMGAVLRGACLFWEFFYINLKREKYRDSAKIPAQGIGAVSFFARGKKDTSG